MLTLSHLSPRSLAAIAVTTTVLAGLGSGVLHWWNDEPATQESTAVVMPGPAGRLLQGLQHYASFYKTLQAGHIEFDTSPKLNGNIISTLRHDGTCLILADSSDAMDVYLDDFRQQTGWSEAKVIAFAMGHEVQHCLNNLEILRVLGTPAELMAEVGKSSTMQALFPTEQARQALIAATDKRAHVFDAQPQLMIKLSREASGDVMGTLLVHQQFGLTPDEVRALAAYRQRRASGPNADHSHDTSAWLLPLAQVLQTQPNLGKTAPPEALLELCLELVAQHHPAHTVMTTSELAR